MRLRKSVNRGLVSLMAVSAFVNITPFVSQFDALHTPVSIAASEENGAEENDIEAIKQAMIDTTPILEAQFAQIPEEEWIAYSERVNNEGGDPSTVYDWAIQDYPAVFAEEANNFRFAMIEDFNIDEESLAEVSDRDLLWEEYLVWLSAGGQEDLPGLAEALVAKYDVEYAESEESESESNSEGESEESSEDESEESEEETDETELAALKDIMINETPILVEQFDAIPIESWLAYGEQVNLDEGGSEQIYNWVVGDYPDVFEATITSFRTTLVDDYNLNEASLNEVGVLDLLWLEYEVWLNAGGQSDFASLADILVAEYGVVVEGESSDESDEESDEEDETGEERLAAIRQAVLESTPITPNQFDAIPASSWLAYADEINEEGGDPATAFNWALRDYPSVFEDSIAHIRYELINSYNLDANSLNRLVSDQTLLWEEYNAWVNNGGNEDLAALAQKLVQSYGVNKVADESNKQPTLPATGEERSPIITALIVILGIAGISLLGFKDKIFKK